MEETGLVLREAREKKGLTIAEAHESTRINPAYLEALESGQYGVLPTPVHVRGFLRNYARYLDLDPEPLLKRFQSDLDNGDIPLVIQNGHGPSQAYANITPEQPFFDPVNMEVESGKRRDPESAVRLLVIAALIVALALIVNRFLPMIAENQDGSAAITAGINDAVQSVLNRDQASEAPETALDGEAEAPPDSSASDGDELITSTSRTNSAAVILPTPTATRPSLPATLEEIRLKVEVTERTWLETTIDGEVVYSGIARNGDAFEWTAADEAALLTGNAIGLFVTINDVPIGRLGDRGENREEIWRTTQ